MREEFTEHERVIGFRMVAGDADVFVHVECNNILETENKRERGGRRRVNRELGARLGGTYESLPSLTSLIKALYVEIGEEPVGRPSTKGFSAVGLKSLILESCGLSPGRMTVKQPKQTSCRCSLRCNRRPEEGPL